MKDHKKRDCILLSYKEIPFEEYVHTIKQLGENLHDYGKQITRP